jgi:lysophospholipase L1-like esterase
MRDILVFGDSNTWGADPADDRSRALPREFARVAPALDVPWLDAGRIIVTSPLDGRHFEASQHELLGVAVAARVRELPD